MVRIEHISPTDVQGNNWLVTCRDAGGAISEFKCGTIELAVEYALLVVELSKWNSASTRRSSSRIRQIGDGLQNNLLPAIEQERAVGRIADSITKEPTHVISRNLNRVGSRNPRIAMAEPKTCGQRITKRRMELRLTQADVALRVRIGSKTGHQKDVERVLSRNAYAMYELDATEPALKTIESISIALSVSPAWLAFGVGKQSTKAKTENRSDHNVIEFMAKRIMTD